MLALHDKMTVTEFDRLIALPENADRHLELFDGEIIETVPNKAHSSLAFHIGGLLTLYLLKNAIGRGLSEQRISLPGQDVNDVLPDVAFITHERYASDPEPGPLRLVPDLCIEIQSSGQSEQYMFDKAHWYLAHGGRMVWVVYPEKGIVEWFTPTYRRLLVNGDSIDGGDVLPGFSVTVAEVLAGK
jgi:Uma2 family endonuclease